MSSLRARLIAAVMLLVGVTVLGSWLAMGAVLRPFLHQVLSGDLKLAVSAVERVEAGEQPAALELELGIRIRRAPWYKGDLNPTPPQGAGMEQTRRRPHNLRAQEVRGRQVHASPNGAVVFVQTARGWAVIRREVDLPEPGLKVIPWLVLVALGVVGSASGLAWVALRPLQRSQLAMTRLSDGDLSHRLEVRGPSEFQAAALAFNTMADRIQSMLRAEKELLAGVSHELRTPLTRLVLELELMRELGPSPKRIDAMAGDLRELNELIEELTRLSRLELGQQPLMRERVDLDAMAQELAQGAERVVVHGHGGLVDVDPGLTRRAVGNLLSNAARYAPAGEISLTLSPGRITVRDRGPGVAADQLEHLFEPFYRAESSRNKHTGGLGLGLMIVRQVAALHGGRASARNHPDGGLEVCLELPQV